MSDTETIKQRIAVLEDAEQEASKIKQVLNDLLAEDDRWQELDLEARDIADKKKKLKAEIQNTQIDALMKLKDIRTELADLKELLSFELIEYHEQTKQQDIECLDGSLRKISIKAKLKKTNQMRLL